MDTKASFDTGLTQAEKDLVAKAKDFARHYLAEDGVDSANHRDLLKQACHRGLAGIEVPESFGGAGASYSTRMRVCEELAYWHAGFAFSLVNHHNIVSRVALSGSPELQSQLVAPMLQGDLIGCTAMTEPQSGSDFTGMHTNAARTNKGWVLNGAKAWITNAGLADVFLVYAQTDAQKGGDGVAGFVVLADDIGFQRGEPYVASGIDGMGVGEFQLVNCFIPDERLLYPPGEGFRAAMRGVNQARVHVAAMNASMVERALFEAVQYSSQRQAFNKPIIDFQGMGWSLANVATNLQAMRLLAYNAAQAIDAKQDAQSHAAMAKKFANDNALLAISSCMQAMGAYGITQQAGLGRMLNWAKAFCYTDGTPEMMNERIVRQMRKKPLR